MSVVIELIEIIVSAKKPFLSLPEIIDWNINEILVNIH